MQNVASGRVNDFASIEAGLQPGPVQIAFIRAPYFFRFYSGEVLPELSSLATTHVIIGNILETGLDEIYRILQKEVWSPNDEACTMLRELGVAHTSIGPGDVVIIGDRYWVCTDSPEGWRELE